MERNDVRTVTVLISYPFVVLEFILHFFPDSNKLSQCQYEVLYEDTEDSQVSPHYNMQCAWPHTRACNNPGALS